MQYIQKLIRQAETPFLIAMKILRTKLIQKEFDEIIQLHHVKKGNWQK